MGDPKLYRDATPAEMIQTITGGSQRQKHLESIAQERKQLNSARKFLLLRDPIQETRFMIPLFV